MYPPDQPKILIFGVFERIGLVGIKIINAVMKVDTNKLNLILLDKMTIDRKFQNKLCCSIYKRKYFN